MKARVIEFAKRIGSKGFTYDEIDKTTLITELADFFTPIGWREGLLVEEVTEFQVALLNKDITEVVDAFIDIKVYLAQIENWLEQAGVDVAGAYNAVCDNNDSKYTTSDELVIKWKNEHKLKGNVYNIKGTYVDRIAYYCLKDNTGKVKKPLDFVPVDLKPFIPKHLLED